MRQSANPSKKFRGKLFRKPDKVQGGVIPTETLDVTQSRDL